MKPLISIAIPCYNCEKTILQTVHSLYLQSFQDWELLLIDDGSEDRTQECFASFDDPRINIFIDGAHLGVIRRLNQALELSEGTYFARIDGDDVAYPERLERQLHYLDQHPQIDLLGTAMIIFNSTGNVLGKRTFPENHDEIVRRPHTGIPMAHPTLIGRLSWFQRYGYRDYAIRCEDQDLLIRSYSTSRFANMPDILLGYREIDINFRKTLLGRRYLAQSLFREFWRQGARGLAVRAVVEQVAKGMIDIFAIKTGLNYKVLRHRAMPASSNEQRAWQHLWKNLNQRVYNGL